MNFVHHRQMSCRALRLPNYEHSLFFQVSSDPFQTCKSPTMFAVGSEGRLSSADYVEVHLSTLDNLREHLVSSSVLCPDLFSLE